jgi:trimeric autotransporter adhesin
MSKLRFLAIALLPLVWAKPFLAQNISTIAGGGSIYLYNGGLATNAALYGPQGVAVDSSGNIYFSDSGTGGSVIYKVSGTTITIVAGNGTSGYSGDGGAATNAELGPWVQGIALDSSGNIYIADVYYSVVRKVTVSTGVISTFAGDNTTLYGGGYSGDGGAATSAELYAPTGVAVDAAGDVYIADSGNKRIRKVTTTTRRVGIITITSSIISTLAGNGTSAYSGDGSAATAAELTNPFGVAVDTSGNFYIADLGLDNTNSRIRKVTISTGIISTVAGDAYSGYSGNGGAATSAELNAPHAVAIDASGNIYIADTDNTVIRKVTVSTGIITTVAGDGTSGYSGDGGAATNAELNFPSGVAVGSSGIIYIADTNNARVRSVVP